MKSRLAWFPCEFGKVISCCKLFLLADSNYCSRLLQAAAAAAAAAATAAAAAAAAAATLCGPCLLLVRPYYESS